MPGATAGLSSGARYAHLACRVCDRPLQASGAISHAWRKLLHNPTVARGGEFGGWAHRRAHLTRCYGARKMAIVDLEPGVGFLPRVPCRSRSSATVWRTSSCRATHSRTWRSSRICASILRRPPGPSSTLWLPGRGVEPDFADAQLFQWHHGQLNGGYEYFVLEYPTPPAIDMLGVSPKDVIDGRASFVLAPHFSAIVRGVEDVHYFVLGQAPMGGGTTLRCILPEGTNCNLGPGPKPELSAFLDAVRGRVARQR